MWNFILILIAAVASIAITVMSFNAHNAMKRLHKSFPDVNEGFIEEQRNRIMSLMLVGVALCGVVIITNIPSFAITYSVLHAIAIIIGSIAYAVACPWIIKKIRA